MTDPLSTGLWNKQQTADYLGIAVSTLNHWICERKIVFIKMGSLVRFRKTDLDRFINKNVHGRKELKEIGMVCGVALNEPQDQV